MATNGNGKMPPSLRILGKRWSIEERQQEEYGLCHQKDTRMTVSADQSLENLRDTLLHETFHAISDDLKCGLSEKQVHVMATATLCVLRDNPGLVRFLTD